MVIPAKKGINTGEKLKRKLVSLREIEKSKEWSKNDKMKNQLRKGSNNNNNNKNNNKNDKKTAELKPMITHKPKASSSMFFSHNTALGPPYRILLDTNFINFSIQNKLDVVKAAMDCLYAKCIPCITDCVMAELEKLGTKFRVALRAAKDPRFERLKCTHKGTYADDCICHRVQANPIYVVATCDKDLKRRLRKIPGVPLMYIKSRRYTIERLPEVDGMGAPRQ